MTYSVNVRFEWDPNKDEANRKKHGLSFDEAKELFCGGKRFLEIYDEGQSDPSAPVLSWLSTRSLRTT